MKASILSISKNPVEAERHALESLRKGELLLFPTETVYGLGVDSRIPEAMERLYEIKGRPREKPFQWLVSDPAQARNGSSHWNFQAERLANAFWPGPLTLVVPTNEGTIGWRVPRHDWLCNLLQKLGRPLIATSANRSGQAPHTSFEPAYSEFADEIGSAVDGGTIAESNVSTVVQLEGNSIRILRQGAIAESEIRRILAG